MMIALEGRKYLTLAEAAKLLRRHYATIYRWTLEDRIAFHQPWPGARILIPESEVTRLKGRHPGRERER